MAIILNMRVSKIGKMIDFVFGNLLVFLIAFVWTRFFWTDTRINICISLIVMILICLIYNFIYDKKYKKIQLSNSEMQNAKNITIKFLMSDNCAILKTFAQNFAKKYPTKMQRNFLIVNSNFFLPVFDKLQIDDKDVLNACKLAKSVDCKKIVIVCNTIGQSAVEATKIADKKVLMLDQSSAYKNIYLPLGFDVPKAEKIEKKKQSSEVFARAFNKKQTKNYLFVAIFMIFASFVLRYNIYYLIFATINGIFALFSHFNKKYNGQLSIAYFDK